MHEVVADTERLLRRTLKDAVALEVAAAPGPAHVLADRGQLEQVLVNLVLNARDAGAGHVTIRTEPATLDGRPHVHVSVGDDGEGMEQWVVERAFEPFFTTKPKGSGTGLGLATVYGIVMGNHGQIALRTSPGKGTIVSMHLPLGGDRPHQPAAAPAPAATAAAAGTVLLVEDEDALRALTRRILGKRGFSVIEAANPEEALAAFAGAETRPDLLLTDVVMPGGSGRELCDRLREQAPGLPTVFMSGYTDEVMERYGVDAPRDELLPKPFDAAALIGAVRRALGEE